MPIRIVETVTADSMAELRRGRALAESRADIVELRIDGVADLDLAAALADRTAPVIVTCRPVWEGGRYDGAEPDRLRLLRRARALGAEFIDVEVRADWRSVVAFDRGGFVLSFHDFAGVPADLEAIADGMARSGADVAKIAVSVERLDDCRRLAAIGRAHRNVVVIGMGAAGAATRVAPHAFGSQWTYAGALTELGQFPVRELREVFGVGVVSESARLYGVVGRPVMHSKSPALHNAAFRAAGIDAVYAPFEAADFADFLAFAAALDVRGASVTAPFKADALAASSRVSEVAAATGAVNTLVRTADGWTGGNTDVGGFLATLPADGVAGLRAAVIGRGGASRAVQEALRIAGAEVTVVGRDELDRASEPWDLLINATPVGTAPEAAASVMAGRPIRARHVFDLVYNPLETRLMADAARAGAQVTGGMPMLVAQAVQQFELWFDRPAPRDAYERAAAAVMTYEANDVRRIR